MRAVVVTEYGGRAEAVDLPAAEVQIILGANVPGTIEDVGGAPAGSPSAKR